MSTDSDQTRSTRSARRFADSSGSVIGAALAVHRALGPGLLESAYEACLSYELTQRGLRVRTQVPVPIVYKGIRLDAGYRLDMLVEEAIVVEIKALEKLERVHFAQVLSYLRLSGHPVGLLINFNVSMLKQGIHRVVNALPET